MSRIIALAAFIFTVAHCSAADVAQLTKSIREAGPDGAGSAAAAEAWKELSNQTAEKIPAILEAMDGATPLAANWLRSAVDAIVERRGTKNIPVKGLNAFVLETQHNAQARRMAFELIRQVTPDEANKLMNLFTNDPSPELRYEAIELARAAALLSPNPKPELMKLLKASRWVEQTEKLAKDLEERGEKVDLTKHFGFITDWHIVSGFDNTGGKGFQTAYPPEDRVDITASYAAKDGKSAKWKEHATTAKYGVVDLNKEIGKEKNVVAYAVVYVVSDKEQPVQLRTASATAVKIYLNGKEALARESYHQGMDVDSHVASGTLKAGRNEIMLKVCQNDQKEPWAQEWSFQLRLTDSLGAALPVTMVPNKPATPIGLKREE